MKISLGDLKKKKEKKKKISLGRKILWVLTVLPQLARIQSLEHVFCS